MATWKLHHLGTHKMRKFQIVRSIEEERKHKSIYYPKGIFDSYLLHGRKLLQRRECISVCSSLIPQHRA